MHKIQIASSTFPQHTHKITTLSHKIFLWLFMVCFPFPLILKNKKYCINSKLPTYFSFKNAPERGKHHRTNPTGLHWWLFSTLKSDHLFPPFVSCFLEVIY